MIVQLNDCICVQVFISSVGFAELI